VKEWQKKPTGDKIMATNIPEFPSHFKKQKVYLDKRIANDNGWVLIKTSQQRTGNRFT